jgi:hypothetical protein
VHADAVIVTWVVVGIVTVALGLSLTPARRTRPGRPAARRILAGGLVVGAAQLVNLYRPEQWTAFLGLVAVPVVLAAVPVARRAARQPAARPTPPPGGLPPRS